MSNTNRCWVRAVRTGTYQSRTGPVTLTTADLQTLVRSFTGAVPVDWEHKSWSPQSPGDGAAAGWLSEVRLDDDGTSVYGLVTWTPRAAEQIHNGEFQFTTPALRHDADGYRLLSLGLTKTPRIEGRRNLFLLSQQGGDVAQELSPDAPALIPPASTSKEPSMPTISLATVHQRVQFVEDTSKTPELTPAQRAAVYEVVAVDGEFVRVADMTTHREFGWFKNDQLQPARAAEGTPSPLDHVKVTKDDSVMNNNAGINAAEVAQTFLLNATRAHLKEHPGLSFADAAKAIAIKHHEVTAIAYPSAITEADARADHPVISLRAQPGGGETFDGMVAARVRETGATWRDAVRQVGIERPDLAAVR